mmetsp:Transcript_539/g.867  ORF Transcript_539/g.867 Transcript_539/m.867 type:complete len:104 (+) Transcript_539:750-1061(+)
MKYIVGEAIKAREERRRLKPEEQPLKMTEEMATSLRAHVFTPRKFSHVSSLIFFCTGHRGRTQGIFRDISITFKKRKTGPARKLAASYLEFRQGEEGFEVTTR